MTVKSHSSQQKANQLDVKIALERTNPKEVLVADETAVIVGSAVTTIDSAMIDQEKCTKQLVLIVVRTAKFLSNRVEISQLDVEIVFKHLETKVSKH